MTNTMTHARRLGLGAAMLALAVGFAAPAATAQDDAVSQSEYEYPFQNPNLSPEERAKDIVSRMTLEEKAAQMYDKAAAIPRLGIHEYNWWNEALHGVARAGHATVFPQAIGLAATWDEDQMLEVATTISDEGRAKHHLYASEDNYPMYGGLTFWSPNINIFRDPRWGRGMETYGEDPYLTGRMAVNFVNGLQGDDDKYLKTVATVKHYAVHSGPEPSRHRDNYEATDADLWETYLPAFKMAMDEADVASVMCAYNAVWGAPACGSERLMVDLLRGDLGFDGYVVSDCGSIGDFYYDEEKMETGEAHYIGHDHVDTRAEAAALAVKMGTDVNCGDGYGNKMDALPEAVEQGLIDEETIDQSVERLYTALFRLGMYDDPSMVPYADTSIDEVASEDNIALSEDTARKSLVLLKNNGVLPLEEGTKVAVIGPNADNYMTLIANYNGIPTQPVTALEGIRAKVGEENVSYALGSTLAEGVYTDFAPVPASVFFHEDDDGELQPGLEAAYYATPDREGEPGVTRIDENIDFYWERGPVENGLNDEFGATWNGVLVPEEDGTYLIKVSRWSEASLDGETIGREPIELEAGEEYAFEMKLALNSGWTRDGLEKFADLTWTRADRDLKAEAMAAAEDADVILYFGGIDSTLEGEEMPVEIEGFLGGDRTSLDLPAVQQDLLEDLAGTDKPLVMVNYSGSAMSLNWAAENVDALVQAFYPGEKGGSAVADLLWGDYSPSGRLPVTFFKSVDQLPGFKDYSMENRTYKYFTGEPLYPFGYGLSYTSFSYADIEVPESHNSGEPMTVSATVTNDGDMAGREVVQVYIKQAERPNPSVPLVELVAFDVVEVQPGESKEVSFTLSPENLGYYDENGEMVSPDTGATISIGGGQPDFVSTATAKVDFASN